MFWGQALIEFRRTNKARSWPNFRAWHLKTDLKSAFATSLVGSRSPPLTTSLGISAFDMSRGTHPPTLPMSSRTHHSPNSGEGMTRDRIQHALVPNGLDAIVGYIKQAGRIPCEVKRVAIDGDLAFVHVRYLDWGGKETAGVDIFRFDENGKVVEHWDVLQPVPASSNNANTMF